MAGDGNFVHMVVFDIGKYHTGDMILALPVMQALKNLGKDVEVSVLRRYYEPARECGIQRYDGRGGLKVRPYTRPGRHRTDDWLARMDRLGYKDLVPARTEWSTKANTELLPGGGWVLFQPWCENPSKQWPVMRWRELGRRLMQDGHKVAVAGPASFRASADLIPGKNICGMDKDNWASTIKVADVVVSVDSGAVHVADALGVKCISMYSDVMPVEVWHPYWDQSGVISRRRMTDITVDDILGKLNG